MNADTVPVDIEIATPFGTVRFADVAPGKSGYQSLKVRGEQPPSGLAQVTARTDDGHLSVTEATYARATCE